MNHMASRSGIGPDESEHELGSAISREINAIDLRMYGRGATKARSRFGDDFVMTILEGILTQAEQTLIEAENLKQVAETRRAFQEAARVEFTKAIEALTGRRVRSFMSQTDPAADVAVELFLLEREP
jgi:uncharacterized protein YbcI